MKYIPRFPDAVLMSRENKHVTRTSFIKNGTVLVLTTFINVETVLVFTTTWCLPRPGVYHDPKGYVVVGPQTPRKCETNTGNGKQTHRQKVGHKHTDRKWETNAQTGSGKQTHRLCETHRKCETHRQEVGNKHTYRKCERTTTDRREG